MYRIWYSTESFADYIINNTVLTNFDNVVKSRLYESDASKPKHFHTMPDHIRKILYLDACDLIVEKDNEPVFSIEISSEAGTGHNAFQRFARIAASVENNVPALYIYPEGVIITRKNAKPTWDKINPLIFKALDSVMSIYKIPTLLYYFPSDINEYLNMPEEAPNLSKKGLHYDNDIINYSGCPDSQSESMQNMFKSINEILRHTEESGVKNAKDKLLSNIIIREQQAFMQKEFYNKSNNKTIYEMSPLTAVERVKTEFLLKYLSKYEDTQYRIGELLKNREYTSIYKINAHFRGDPYPGAFAAIDYLISREGKTFEDRRDNLVLLFGKLYVDEINQTLNILNERNSTIKDFFNDVKNSSNHNLLQKNYDELVNYEIPRYLMQVRYGSTYSKAKHIRVFSYFADAILFPDGAIWRDA